MVEGKRLKRTNPVDGMMTTFRIMAGLEPSYEEARNKALRYEEGDIIVDTCLTIDTGLWETGISKRGSWTIVEQYKDELKAEVGHKKWVDAMKADPEMKLRDIDLWGLNDSDDEDEDEEGDEE